MFEQVYTSKLSKRLNSSFDLIDSTLTDTSTADQTRPWRNGCEGLLQFPKTSRKKPHQQIVLSHIRIIVGGFLFISLQKYTHRVQRF